MSKAVKVIPNEERFKAADALPFYSVGITRSHGAIYLKQYRLSQGLAASRGLLEGSTHMASHPPRSEEFPRGYLEQDDEMVLARLRKAQASVETSFSRLDQDLQQLQKAFLSTRKEAAGRTGLITLFACGFLSIIISLSRRGHIRSLEVVPRRLQSIIPFLPSPIAILLIANRERQICAVNATRSRVQMLRANVKSSQSVSLDEIDWLENEEWDGVDWGLISL